MHQKNVFKDLTSLKPYQECKRERINPDELNSGDKSRKKLSKDTKWLKEKKLQLYGKINIIQTFGRLITDVWNLSVPVIPENFIIEVEKRIFNFMWDGKSTQITKSTIADKKRLGTTDPR